MPANPEPRTCPQCGAKLPDDSPGGLCIKCLLQLGLNFALSPASERDVESLATEEVQESAVEEPLPSTRNYRILEKLGEGGCGVVYLAEQLQPLRRHVALKVIKLGMDTKAVIARFQAEKQVLALMDHPNIAKVLDAGVTETGRPYFVMELVHGVRITDYCDQRKLTTRQRLDLFVQVCQAVQHAHLKGIIHRDIKPSNILVAEQDGMHRPIIIDFGIAKATSEEIAGSQTLFTSFQQFLGTPAYMSPEQACGLDVDTRSDVYSLGALLYELITGRPPFGMEEFRRIALDGVLRIIREKEPLRPSTRLSALTESELTTVSEHRQIEPNKLRRLVTGELDWIAMRALEKDRSRRYETVHELAQDIGHYLQGETVVASPPALGYRARKFIRRHRVAVSLIAVSGSLILAGLVTVVFRLANALREHHQALQRAAAHPGLVSWWRAEANPRDSFGTNHGTLVNGAAFSAGMIGQAFSLNGFHQRVDVPTSPSLEITGPITAEAWIRPSMTSRQRPILEKYGADTGGWGLRVQEGNAAFFTADGCCDSDLVGGRTRLTSNVWYHVAGTWDGAALRVYVNGALDGVLPSSRSPKAGPSPLRIGARGDDAFELFSGQIDEACVYSRALPATEIQAIYQTGLARNKR